VLQLAGAAGDVARVHHGIGAPAHAGGGGGAPPPDLRSSSTPAPCQLVLGQAPCRYKCTARYCTVLLYCTVLYGLTVLSGTCDDPVCVSPPFMPMDPPLHAHGPRPFMPMDPPPSCPWTPLHALEPPDERNCAPCAPRYVLALRDPPCFPPSCAWQVSILKFIPSSALAPCDPLLRYRMPGWESWCVAGLGSQVHHCPVPFSVALWPSLIPSLTCIALCDPPWFPPSCANAGLRSESITAKHLALSSQCISLVFALLPGTVQCTPQVLCSPAQQIQYSPALHVQYSTTAAPLKRNTLPCARGPTV